MERRPQKAKFVLQYQCLFKSEVVIKLCFYVKIRKVVNFSISEDLGTSLLIDVMESLPRPEHLERGDFIFFFSKMLSTSLVFSVWFLLLYAGVCHDFIIQYSKYKETALLGCQQLCQFLLMYLYGKVKGELLDQKSC